MKRDTTFKIIAFIFMALVLISLSYVYKNTTYLIYALIPCALAFLTYFNDKRNN